MAVICICQFLTSRTGRALISALTLALYARIVALLALSVSVISVVALEGRAVRYALTGWSEVVAVITFGADLVVCFGVITCLAVGSIAGRFQDARLPVL